MNHFPLFHHGMKKYCLYILFNAINYILVSFKMSQNPEVQIFEAEFDSEGVYFYQAYKDSIAEWALVHQKLGGKDGFKFI